MINHALRPTHLDTFKTEMLLLKYMGILMILLKVYTWQWQLTTYKYSENALCPTYGLLYT